MTGPRSRAGTRCTDPRIPRPDPSLSARAQKAAVNVCSRVRRGSPALYADPPGSPPRESGPERSSDRQGERPVSVAENPGLAGCTSQGRKHTHETHAGTRTPSPKLIKKKNQPTHTKCRRCRRSALTSRCREDRMPTPGYCHFHSAPGTWAPLPFSLRTAPSSDRCLPCFPLQSPPPSPSVGNVKTIRAKPDPRGS